MTFHHIVFDIDGTLLDTEDAILRSLQTALLQLNHKTVPLSELTFVLGITGRDALL